MGIEIRLEPGCEDFLIYGIDEAFLFSTPGLCFFDQQDIYKLCHEYGAVFYQAHPFREPCIPRSPEFLDGVEYNQRPGGGNHNERLDVWIKNYPHLKRVSGSDCHDVSQAGFGGIETEEEVNDIKELTELMKEKQVKLIITEETAKTQKNR